MAYFEVSVLRTFVSNEKRRMPKPAPNVDLNAISNEYVFLAVNADEAEFWCKMLFRLAACSFGFVDQDHKFKSQSQPQPRWHDEHLPDHSE